MASPTQERNFLVPEDRHENAPAAGIRELEDIVTAQEAHIKELSEMYDRLNKRVKVLESFASRSSANMESFKGPVTTQSDNMQNPRRLAPTMIQTIPMGSPFNPNFQTPPIMLQEHGPMSPPRPLGYRPPYTDVGAEQSSGTLPGHTVSHAAGFTPINCSCALPHTLENGDTQFPRQGFT